MSVVLLLYRDHSSSYSRALTSWYGPPPLTSMSCGSLTQIKYPKLPFTRIDRTELMGTRTALVQGQRQLQNGCHEEPWKDWRITYSRKPPTPLFPSLPALGYCSAGLSAWARSAPAYLFNLPGRGIRLEQTGPPQRSAGRDMIFLNSQSPPSTAWP